MHVRRQTQRKIEIEAELRERECLAADKEVIVHVLRLIVAHLHPELAEAKTPTSAQDPGVNFTIKTSMAHKN